MCGDRASADGNHLSDGGGHDGRLRNSHGDKFEPTVCER